MCTDVLRDCVRLTALIYFLMISLWSLLVVAFFRSHSMTQRASLC